MLLEQGNLLRIFVGEMDKHDGKPLYEWIVHEAKSHGLKGATVIRGIEGFGAKSLIHTAKILSLSPDLPLIIEIADNPEKIEAFLPVLDSVMKEGMLTVEKVHVRFYRDGAKVEPD